MKLSKEQALAKLRVLVQTQCLDSFDAVQHLQATGHSCQVNWMEVVAELEKELFPIIEEPQAQIINLNAWVNMNRLDEGKIPSRLLTHINNRFSA